MAKTMNDSHRLFLQSFMSKGILLGRDVRKLFRQSSIRFHEDFSEDGLVEFVSTINSNIKPLHLEIRKAITEDAGSHCYGLVNTRDSDITKLASDFTVNELEFFKKLVEKIVESDTGTLSSIETLNLADQMDKKIAKKDAQDLLLKMEEQHWLSKNPQGMVALSPRSILELEQYMFEQYPDSAVKCNMCKRICLQGQACASCTVKLHSHCATRFFEKKVNKTCPGPQCGQPWPHEIRQKEPGTSSELSSSQPTQPDNRKRRGLRT